jgi:hypothetical protein
LEDPGLSFESRIYIKRGDKKKMYVRKDVRKSKEDEKGIP